MTTEQRELPPEHQFVIELGALAVRFGSLPNGIRGAHLIHAAIACMTVEAGRRVTALEAQAVLAVVLQASQRAGHIL